MNLALNEENENFVGEVTFIKIMFTPWWQGKWLGTRLQVMCDRCDRGWHW